MEQTVKIWSALFVPSIWYIASYIMMFEKDVEKELVYGKENREYYRSAFHI